MKIFVCMTSHNRRDMTVRCVRQLRKTAEKLQGLRVVLVDAGSTDGTAESVRREWPQMVVLEASSDVYWAEGMSIAEHHVWDNLSPTAGDFFLWLNDDVILDDDALRRAIEHILSRESPGDSIYVGAMRSSTGGINYGGLMRSKLNPLRIWLTKPRDVFTEVDAFHGNFVLVPHERARTIGRIDGAYGHHMADIDYAIRNTTCGGKNLLLPGTFGVCDTGGGPVHKSTRDHWHFYKSIRGSGHWQTRLRFMRSHSALPAKMSLLAMDAVYFFRLMTSRGVVKSRTRKD